ncbi:thioesterase family protein [Camelimonas abortus]|uniref:Thioesterase family protein n=1 Tax=Camelimonas abortus TaxID=1017184 RepID=A0ABV7LFK4_9HYPH
MHKSYFITEGERYVPTSISRGYWVDDTVTGAATASLLAACLEQAWGGPDYVATRFSIDMLGLVPARPLKVELRLLKDGRRLKLGEASITGDDGQLLARATCQFALRTQNPENATWQAPGWSAPSPEQMGPHLSFGSWDLLPLPPQYNRIRKEGFHAPRVAPGNAPVLGPLCPVEARQAWFRPNNRAVADMPLTPFLRAAMVADFVSPVANSSEYGIDFINTDFTLYLCREPAGEWIGLEMVSHHARDGIAIGECWLHDVAGPLGSVNLSALAQLRKRTGPVPRDPEPDAAAVAARRSDAALETA